MDKPTLQLEPVLVDAATAAALLSVSRSHFLKLYSAGLIPQCQKLGNRSLWAVNELREWSEAGCLSRERWESMRRGCDG